MDNAGIVAQIDAEISKLQQAKAILASTSDLRRPKGFVLSLAPLPQSLDGKSSKRVMSAEGKARIAAAQKARWAKVRKTAKKSTRT